MEISMDSSLEDNKIEYAYYLLKNGKYINTNDIKAAFEIVEGYRPEDDDERFAVFLRKLMVSTIDRRVNADDCTVRGMVIRGQKIKAIQLFREIHHCSLAKASECVTDYMNSLP